MDGCQPAPCDLYSCWLIADYHQTCVVLFDKYSFVSVTKSVRTLWRMTAAHASRVNARSQRSLWPWTTLKPQLELRLMTRLQHTRSWLRYRKPLAGHVVLSCLIRVAGTPRSSPGSSWNAVQWRETWQHCRDGRTYNSAGVDARSSTPADQSRVQLISAHFRWHCGTKQLIICDSRVCVEQAMKTHCMESIQWMIHGRQNPSDWLCPQPARIDSSCSRLMLKTISVSNLMLNMGQFQQKHSGKRYRLTLHGVIMSCIYRPLINLISTEQRFSRKPTTV